MEKILDIIIPQYSENEEKIKPLLDSINNQKNINFNDISVTIVNDASNILLNDSFLNGYDKLNIKYLINDRNTGPGLARQKGVDNTFGKYIMFCDSDDELYQDLALYYIIEFIKKKNPLYLVTNIVVEMIDDDRIVNVVRKNKETFPWMHGKVYQRKFLLDNNIRFSLHVRHLEDTYYTNSILGIIDLKEINYFDCNTYLWKQNKESLTRKDDNIPYLVKIFDDYYNCAIYLYDFLKERGSKQKFNHLIMSSFGIFIALNSNLFDSYIDKREEYLNKLKIYLENKKNIFKLYKREDLNKLYLHQVKELKIRNNIKNVYSTLEDFMNICIK